MAGNGGLETGFWEMGGESGELGGSWREDLEGWREGWRAVWRPDSPDLGKTGRSSPGPKEPASYIPGHIGTCFVHLSRSTVTNVTYRHDLETGPGAPKTGVKLPSCHQDGQIWAKRGSQVRDQKSPHRTSLVTLSPVLYIYRGQPSKMLPIDTT